MRFGQSTVARLPKGPKAAPTQKPVTRTRAHAREELLRRWKNAPERWALLLLAWWITRQMPDIELAKSIEVARQRLVSKAGSVASLTEADVTVDVAQLRVVVRVGGREHPMVFSVASGEWWPDVPEKQGLYHAHYVHGFQRVSADIGPFIGELCSRYGSEEAKGVDFVDDEPVPRCEARAVRASSAIHRCCSDAIKSEKGRSPSVLGLFAELIHHGGVALGMPVRDSKELLLLAMASGFESGNRSRPQSDESHADRWRLLLRKARRIENRGQATFADPLTQLGGRAKRSAVSTHEITGRAPFTEKKIMSSKTTSASTHPTSTSSTVAGTAEGAR